MAIPEESPEKKQTRKERLEDGRVALVRIRHRLQRIQDEMDEINKSRRKPRADREDR
ncbi:MAG TPA: hypothetical protein VIO84_13225 [Candidatus Dormibacteraeota bacterium]|jgi:hypothetical protein